MAIKLSVCQKCKQNIRVADEEYLNKTMDAWLEFMAEVYLHNLAVQTVEASALVAVGTCKCEE
jgi:hypothetical protein